MDVMKNCWGDIYFELDEVKTWRIGQRKISVQRKKTEWLIWNEKTEEENFEALVLENSVSNDIPISVLPQRYLLKSTQPYLTAKPLLADRSIIVRPNSILNILPGETIDLYVSSPLWMAFYNMAFYNTALCNTTFYNTASYNTKETLPISEIPFWLPSDSWFGPNTMVGELCYSKYTDAKVTLDNIQKRSHRAITKISISNEHDESLAIERLSLPTPLLDLYIDTNNQFWTDQVHLIHHLDSERPSFDIKSLASESAAKSIKLISVARKIANENTFMRSIRSLVA